MQVVGKHRRLVSSAVGVGVFENHQLVVGLVARIDMRIGRGTTDPQPPQGIPAHLDRSRDIGKLFFTSE